MIGFASQLPAVTAKGALGLFNAAAIALFGRIGLGGAR